MEVYVKNTATYKVVKLWLEEDSTVLDLKQEIDRKFNLPPEQQRLVFGGSILASDNRMLVQYDILPRVTVHLTPEAGAQTFDFRAVLRKVPKNSDAISRKEGGRDHNIPGIKAEPRPEPVEEEIIVKPNYVSKKPVPELHPNAVEKVDNEEEEEDRKWEQEQFKLKLQTDGSIEVQKDEEDDDVLWIQPSASTERAVSPPNDVAPDIDSNAACVHNWFQCPGCSNSYCVLCRVEKGQVVKQSVKAPSVKSVQKVVMQPPVVKPIVQHKVADPIIREKVPVDLPIRSISNDADIWDDEPEPVKSKSVPKPQASEPTLPAHSGPTVSYDELLRRPVGLDPTKLETYLSDEEFQSVFKVSRADFVAMPRWKQMNKKKALKLF